MTGDHDPLDALQAADEARSTGEWMVYAPSDPTAGPGGYTIRRFPWPMGETEMVVQGGRDHHVGISVGVLTEADADFIVKAANHVSTLLARLRAAEAERDELRAALGTCGGFISAIRDDQDAHGTLALGDRATRICQEIAAALTKYREVAG